MNTSFLTLPENATVADALADLKKDAESVEYLHNIFLVDEGGPPEVRGPIARLFFAPGSARLRDYASDPLLCVPLEEKQDRVAEMFDRYNLISASRHRQRPACDRRYHCR